MTSDGCGRDAVLMAVDQWYDFREFWGYLGNVGFRGYSGSRFRAAGGLLIARSGSRTRSSAGSISTSRLANFGRGEGHKWAPQRAGGDGCGTGTLFSCCAKIAL